MDEAKRLSIGSLLSGEVVAAVEGDAALVRL
jgi:hypothetical protein